MQTASFTVRAPVAAGPRRTAVVARAAAGEAPALSRRSLAALLAVPAALLPVAPALALIPDDDDEELIEKARANRKNRLASERATEKTYARSSGFVDSDERKDLIPVQRAINSLGLAGQQLSGGDVGAAAGTLGGSWAGQLNAATADLSGDDSSRSLAKAVASEIAELQGAAAAGSLANAKREYVHAVGALTNWANAAGVAASLKGL